MIGRIYTLAAILIAGSGAMMASNRGISESVRTERFMEDAAPNVVDGMGFAKSKDDPRQSYKMDKTTYETLDPYGIVCRQYGSSDAPIEAVLIASRHKGSFHDPHVCFTAQGNTIVSEVVDTVQTKERGPVPVRLAEFHGANSSDQYVAYFYKGPYGFRDSAEALKFDIYKYELIQGKSPESVFYRFIANKGKTSEQEFLKFIADYMDAAKDSSNGFF